MRPRKKTEAFHADAKLDLRRTLLAQHTGPLRVLDCASGQDTPWRRLRDMFHVEDYLAFHKTKATGRAPRLVLDDATFLGEHTGDFTVIDLDAYGSPWDHWLSILKWGKPMLVFLTLGGNGTKKASRRVLDLAGLPQDTPPSMHAGLHGHITDQCLSACLTHGFTVSAAYEATGAGAVRFLGLDLVRNPV